MVNVWILDNGAIYVLCICFTIVFTFFLQCDSQSPYPTVQLVDSDWKMAFTRKVPVLVKVDSVDLC